jgi:glycosyltransferase involved in cell wall biosynthesis
MSKMPPAAPPLSVGVTLDLHRGPEAGGHVKCWERFAEAALDIPEALDLTVYVLGKQEAVDALGPNVRFHAVPPVFGTERIPFLKQGAGETDLAGHHARLAELLPRHQLLHHTHAFALSRTAVRVARKRGLPLTASLHTDLERFTRHYAGEILGRNLVGRILLDRFHLDEVFARREARQVARLLAPCRRILISRKEDIARFAPTVEAWRIGYLRRGIDFARFDPAFHDRTWLQERFGIAPETSVLLFVGRLDESKRVLTLARAAKRLREGGRDLAVLVVGEGGARAGVRALLGDAAVMPGQLQGEELSRAYASSDLFVFPSDSEVFGNVVIEARASGLPVLVTNHEGIGARTIGQDGVGLVVPGQDPGDWARAIESVLDDPEGRASMSRRARETVVRDWPSWRQVLEEDLVPVWRAAAAEAVLG